MVKMGGVLHRGVRFPPNGNGTLTPFRQGNSLAEGQKSADGQHISHLPPLSARQNNWRRGVFFPKKTHVLAIGQCHLAGWGRRRSNGLIALQSHTHAT